MQMVKKIAVGWKILGYTSLLGAFGILAYYMVLGGWVLEYIGSLLTGKLDFSQPLNVEYTASFLKREYPRQSVGYYCLHASFCYPKLLHFGQRDRRWY